MSSHRVTHFLLVLVAILLLANLVRPLFAPTPAFAESEKPAESVAMTGSGSVAWILKGTQVYYLRFEQQFESIRIYGPEDLED